MTALFWIGFSIEVLVILVLGYRALQRYEQSKIAYVGGPGAVWSILKPVALLAPLCAGGLAALFLLQIPWLAALIVWLPLAAVILWVLLMLIGGISSGRWN